MTFAPNNQLSPQVNQDYNHNSKERIVLFFSFFFLKGVRAWKIQHTNETNCQKKIYKKIENRKMYLQVVHYYDQKHKDASCYNTCISSGRKDYTLQGRSLQKQKGPKRFIFSSLICYTDHNPMRSLNAHEYLSTNTILVFNGTLSCGGKDGSLSMYKKARENGSTC